MSLINDAIALATKAHAGQTDKAGASYIQHVLRVVERCRTPDAKVVAALHDVVEDCGDAYSFESLSEQFPAHIVEALRCVTKTHEDEPYEEFIRRAVGNDLAREVKLADLEDNLDVTRLTEVTERDARRLTTYLNARQILLKHGQRVRPV